MRLILNLVLFIFILNRVDAQNQHEFFGVIKLNDTSVISYKILFEIHDNKIEGFSVTDLTGEHETKSRIVGSYNDEAKQLSFKESSIIYTKSPITEDDFCMIHFSSSKFRLGFSQKLAGKFKGLFQDRTECINGEIIMSSADKVSSNVEKINKKIERTKRIPDSIKNRINIYKMMDTLSMNVLKEDKIVNVFSQSKSVEMFLYDGGQEDGDRISVEINGKMILRDYLINKNHKKISIPLNTKLTSIVLKALNVGTISTNTAVVELEDGQTKIRALTNLKEGEKTEIHIHKK